MSGNIRGGQGNAQVISEQYLRNLQSQNQAYTQQHPALRYPGSPPNIQNVQGQTKGQTGARQSPHVNNQALALAMLRSQANEVTLPPRSSAYLTADQQRALIASRARESMNTRQRSPVAPARPMTPTVSGTHPGLAMASASPEALSPHNRMLSPSQSHRLQQSPSLARSPSSYLHQASAPGTPSRVGSNSPSPASFVDPRRFVNPQSLSQVGRQHSVPRAFMMSPPKQPKSTPE